MEKTMIHSLFFISCCLFAGSDVSAAEKGWSNLFNGKNLDGFQQNNGTATYRVEDGAIVGKTNEGSPNSFLCTKKHYSDFELKFEVKVDNALNSGVQIRSATKEIPLKGVCMGHRLKLQPTGLQALFTVRRWVLAGSVKTEAERKNSRLSRKSNGTNIMSKQLAIKFKPGSMGFRLRI